MAKASKPSKASKASKVSTPSKVSKLSKASKPNLVEMQPEPVKRVGGFRLPVRVLTDPPIAAVASVAVVDSDDPPCPKCSGPMWDNRRNKRNPRAPDFKCRDRGCDGVLWPRRQSAPSVLTPNASAAGTMNDRWIVREDKGNALGLHWLVTVSKDGSCAFAFCQLRDKNGDQTLEHWGIAWQQVDTERFADPMGQRFVHLTKGDKSGCYCRKCQRHDCSGAKAAAAALAGQTTIPF